MYKMYKRCVVLVDTRVKQADVVLLGYPLMFNMTEATRRNDLRIYEAVSFHMYCWNLKQCNKIVEKFHLSVLEHT